MIFPSNRLVLIEMRYLCYMKLKIREHQIKKLFNKLNEGGDKPNPDFERFAKYFEESATEDGFILKQPNQPGGPNDTQPKDNEKEEWLHPLGKESKILTDFGPSKDGKNHNGLDLSAPSGSQVFAPADGTVLDAIDTSPNSCGGYIKIDHTELHTKYCHLKKWVVRKGDKVKRGQLIGYTGGGSKDPYRGASNVPHLHYETLTPTGVSIRPDHIS